MLTPTSTRKELRQKVAERINKLSRRELRQLAGISRVADITRMDRIGLPVYTAVRPLSGVVATHSGKGLDPQSARAGAIIEGIECEVASHPTGNCIQARGVDISSSERIDLTDCFRARASAVNDLMPIAWEEMTNIHNGHTKLVPSDLLWLVKRIPDEPFVHFQSGSNGLAGGASLEDAILSGLYEILERDAWTTNSFWSEHSGILPDRIPSPLPFEEQIESADCKLYLFDLTTDYQIPTFSAYILDLSGNVAGAFSGYGCHLNAEIAAIRAVTEAAQSRCVYISGARDDLYRRQFLLMKRLDQIKLDKMFSERTEITAGLDEYRKIEFSDVRSELRYLLKLVRQLGINEVYVKELGMAADVHVVRVMSPQCEPAKLDHWAPTFRCINYCSRKEEKLKKECDRKAAEALREEEDPSESWKNG